MGNITINSNITGGGGGGTGDVSGGSNLTTVGAIPYVSAAGTLNQDATQLFWDAANNRLGVGTNAPTESIQASGIRIFGPTNNTVGGNPGVYISTTTSGSYSALIQSTTPGASGNPLSIGGRPLAFFDSFSGSESARFSTSGNFLLGTIAEGNFKLDVASSGSSGTLRVYDQTATTGTTKAVFRNGAGQTGSLIEIQTSGGVTVGSIATTSMSMPNIASDGNLFGAVHQVANNGRIDFSNGSVYSQSIRRRSDDIIAFDNNTAIGTTPGNARDVMLRGVYAAETTSDPSAADLSIAGSNAQDTFRLYMKNDKLVVAYNRSGTVNYLTIPLDGATTSWTQSTTAP